MTSHMGAEALVAVANRVGYRTDGVAEPLLQLLGEPRGHLPETIFVVAKGYKFRVVALYSAPEGDRVVTEGVAEASYVGKARGAEAALRPDEFETPAKFLLTLNEF